MGGRERGKGSEGKGELQGKDMGGGETVIFGRTKKRGGGQGECKINFRWKCSGKEEWWPIRFEKGSKKTRPGKGGGVEKWLAGVRSPRRNQWHVGKKKGWWGRGGGGRRNTQRKMFIQEVWDGGKGEGEKARSGQDVVWKKNRRRQSSLKRGDARMSFDWNIAGGKEKPGLAAGPSKTRPLCSSLQLVDIKKKRVTNHLKPRQKKKVWNWGKEGIPRKKKKKGKKPRRLSKKKGENASGKGQKKKGGVKGTKKNAEQKEPQDGWPGGEKKRGRWKKKTFGEKHSWPLRS